jgi:uncharacterized protein
MKVSAAKAYLIDTNILIYAFRKEVPEHPIALEWLSQALDGGARLVVHSVAAAGFLRLATLPIGTAPAAPFAAAAQFLRYITEGEAWLPSRTSLLPLETMERLNRDTPLAGSAVYDAVLAAFALENGLPIVTRDKDFGRIAPSLTVINPFAAA